MIHINPISKKTELINKKMLFLAGPIAGSENWQSKVIEDLSDLDIYIANPRREKDPNFNYEHQVDWESKHLAKADVIMFWIPNAIEDIEGRSYAQTSRFELGEWLAKTNYNRDYTKVVLGVEDGFPGKRYFQERAKNTNVTIYDNYEDTLQMVRKLMSARGEIFFTSDTHFGSQRALELSRRPFDSVNDMNVALVSNWNRLIRSYDTVYHLGDFGDISFINQLKGNIHLIMGNYEEEEIKKDSHYFDKLKKSFASIEANKTLELINGETIFLSHKPSGSNMNMFNAFGHIHGKQKCKIFGLDVGVDAHNYRPISEKTFLFYKDAIDHHYDDEVFL